MPSSAKVFIQYGPYRAVGIVEHRTSRLQGLISVLERDGHKVELVQIEDWNSVQLSVNGESVFQCNITDLDYGSDGDLDPLCQDAKKIVKNAH